MGTYYFNTYLAMQCENEAKRYLQAKVRLFPIELYYTLTLSGGVMVLGIFFGTFYAPFCQKSTI